MELDITVVCSPRAGEVVERAVRLPAGSTAKDAVQASQVLLRHPQLDVPPLRLGVWGRRCPPEAVLRDGDRVELYRPLLVDPMQARRLRQQRAAGATCRTPTR